MLGHISNFEICIKGSGRSLSRSCDTLPSERQKSKTPKNHSNNLVLSLETEKTRMQHFPGSPEGKTWQKSLVLMGFIHEFCSFAPITVISGFPRLGYGSVISRKYMGFSKFRFYLKGMVVLFQISPQRSPTDVWS